MHLTFKATRRIAMEFLVNLAEQGKGMIRKFKQFPAQVIPVAFQYLLDIEHTEEWDKVKTGSLNFSHIAHGIQVRIRVCDSR